MFLDRAQGCVRVEAGQDHEDGCPVRPRTSKTRTVPRDTADRALHGSRRGSPGTRRQPRGPRWQVGRGTMSFGRPVDPPEVIARSDGLTRSGRAASLITRSGSHPLGSTRRFGWVSGRRRGRASSRPARRSRGVHGQADARSRAGAPPRASTRRLWLRRTPPSSATRYVTKSPSPIPMATHARAIRLVCASSSARVTVRWVPSGSHPVTAGRSGSSAATTEMARPKDRPIIGSTSGTVPIGNSATPTSARFDPDDSKPDESDALTHEFRSAHITAPLPARSEPHRTGDMRWSIGFTGDGRCGSHHHADRIPSPKEPIFQRPVRRREGELGGPGSMGI